MISTFSCAGAYLSLAVSWLQTCHLKEGPNQTPCPIQPDHFWYHSGTDMREGHRTSRIQSWAPRCIAKGLSFCLHQYPTRPEVALRWHRTTRPSSRPAFPIHYANYHWLDARGAWQCLWGSSWWARPWQIEFVLYEAETFGSDGSFTWLLVGRRRCSQGVAPWDIAGFCQSSLLIGGGAHGCFACCNKSNLEGGMNWNWVHDV